MNVLEYQSNHGANNISPMTLTHWFLCSGPFFPFVPFWGRIVVFHYLWW